MLKIMERPLVSNTTSFQHMKRECNATTYNKHRTLSRSGSQTSMRSAGSKGRKRSNSVGSGRNTPTAGLGPTSLNLSARKREMADISRQNHRLVTNLVQVQPKVPRFE